MSGKKKRRVPTRQELALRSPVGRAQLRARPMPAEKQTSIVVAARLAFDRITRGDCRPDDPDELATVANVSMVLCEKGHGAEYLPQVLEAHEALLNAQRRENEGLTFNFTGPERQAIKETLDLCEQQVQITSHMDVMQALMDVHESIAQWNVSRLARTTRR